MDTWLDFICYYAPHAWWIFFIMLMLAGLNIPLSEDIILLTGGALVSTCIPEQKIFLYITLYLGCIFSAWEAYWIGRLLGPKLYDIKWFKHIITEQRINRLHHYYEKFGIWAFIVGRFCPGGVRNALFMTSGLGKMPFPIFVMRDGIACLISSLTIFSIGYLFAENYDSIVHAFHKFSWVFIFILIIAVISFYLWKRYKPNNVMI